jgi:putative hemolysin
MAIVIDEFGGTAGLVTVEDLMEELFGEIEEYATADIAAIRAVNKNTFNVPASATIELVNESLHLNVPEGEYETIAGFILSRLQRVPRSGEMITLDDCRIVINKSSRKRIEEIRIVKRNG